MKFNKYYIVLFLIPLFAFSIHKYYLSLCEIEYVEEQKSIQIILGLFIDDIELTLNKNNSKNLHLATKNEVENVNEYYESYLNNHFKVIVDKKQLQYNFLGKVYDDDDIVRFYLEITNVPKFKTLEIFNTNLIDDFDDQQNIIKIKIKDFNKTFYLTKKNTNCLLKL